MIPRWRGFTLIELLVVLAIVGIALSLIGPVGINQYERMQVTEEREKFLRQLDATAFQALRLQADVTVRLQQQQLQVYMGEQLVQRHTYERLQFPAQELQLNSHGFWTPAAVRWVELEQSRQRELNPPAIEGAANAP
ncbi:hypothetical protein C9928_04110 [Pseudidiomarina aestuarii]|uniref:Type II secretion system protein n=1 Tax=Pseudidiomarina aestuarii TaxID=624146 RepID=A0A2T4CU88_9GAMM|nr:hypothetical protein C9986_00385 [Pseudidiomarina aestuarii]PTB85134.1 hypothetical protein C9988_02465 [Pseudidiomarina aestuarii]PTB89265.1 hypothetical protein C9928_04110 [Pseudidiomarina aestuarii]